MSEIFHEFGAKLLAYAVAIRANERLVKSTTTPHSLSVADIEYRHGEGLHVSIFFVVYKKMTTFADVHNELMASFVRPPSTLGGAMLEFALSVLVAAGIVLILLLYGNTRDSRPSQTHESHNECSAPSPSSHEAHAPASPPAAAFATSLTPIAGPLIDPLADPFAGPSARPSHAS